MKIVFCIDGLKKGGAERVVTNLANEFSKKNKIGIITTSSTKSDYQINDNVSIYSLTNEKNDLFSKLLRPLKMYSLLKKLKPDIVLTFLPPQSLRVLLVKKILKLKVIVSVRNDPKVEAKNFKYKIGMKLLYGSADGFVFQTKEAQDFFSKKIIKKSTIIPNPINESFICKPYNGTRDKTIVTVGRLEPQKNHKLLIEAFNEVHKSQKDYKLLIYGDGSLKDELKGQIKALDLIDSVILKGNVNDIKGEIYKSGLFVLSSDFEGMPNALMEAMALGLPCISTDCPCGGPRFLIKDKKNGLLIDVNKKDELVDAIKYMIDNQKKAFELGNEANKICDDLNPRKINKLWEEYIIKNINHTEE